MRLQEVEITSFRGFREHRRFDFQGVDILVLYGPNGHGKSSFFDAIEWGLTGAIHRYDETSDERKRSRFIGNRFSQRAPQVVVKLAGHDGTRVTITRTGTATLAAQTDYGASSLVLEIDGESLDQQAAEERLRELLVAEAWRGKVDINRGLSLTHLLGQERMNYFLRGMSGNERYDALSLLFGTEQFYRYRETIKTLQRDVESKRDVTEGRLRALLAEQNERERQIQSLLSQWEDLEETPLQLQEALFSYMGLFMPIDPGTTPEGIWLLIKQHQEELVGEKVRFELGEQQTLRIAYQSLPKWHEAQAVLATARQQVGQLERLKELKQRIMASDWLFERCESFLKANEQRAQLAEELQVAHERTDRLRQEAYRLNQLISTVDDSLDEAIDHGGFELVIEQVRGSDVEAAVRDKLLARLSTLGPLYQDVVTYKESVKEADAIVQQWQKMYDQVAVLDQKYRNLLSSVQEYVAMTQDVESCPACGTPDISSEHLLRHLKAEQEVLNPQLPAIGESLMEAKQRCQDKQEQAQQANQQYEEAVELTDQLLNALEYRAKDLSSEAMVSHVHAEQVHAEIDQLDQLMVEFKERALRLALDVEASDLTERLVLLKQQQAAEWQNIAEGFPADVPLDVEQTLAEWTHKIIHLEQGQQQFVQMMGLLGHVQAENEVWTPEEVERLLADTLQQQRDWLEEQEQKEQVALRVLSVLSRYERYQELEEHKKRYEGLQAEIERVQAEQMGIEADLEILKEVYKKVPEAVDRLNEKVIAELFGTIQSIFERINSHPLYRTLDFEKGQRFGSNRLLLRVLPGSGEETEQAANPSFIFSSAQVNSIALSFFLAMALQQQWSPLRLIAMDDPVQSLDDLNVLALIDLLRSMCENQELGRQVMISTHDRTFYQMILKKFRFLNVGIIEYEGYGEAGPVIKPQVDPLGQTHYVARNPPVTVKPLDSAFLRS